MKKEDPLLGKWPVAALPDMVDDYLTLTSKPRLEITGPTDGIYDGRFSFGAQEGFIYGVLRKDLGEVPCFVFSFEGEDEGDPVHGAAVMKLNPDGSLAGEWIYHNGDIFRVECRR